MRNHLVSRQKAIDGMEVDWESVGSVRMDRNQMVSKGHLLPSGLGER